jgi:hypothetical protein
VGENDLREEILGSAIKTLNVSGAVLASPSSATMNREVVGQSGSHFPRWNPGDFEGEFVVLNVGKPVGRYSSSGYGITVLENFDLSPGQSLFDPSEIQACDLNVLTALPDENGFIRYVCEPLPITTMGQPLLNPAEIRSCDFNVVTAVPLFRVSPSIATANVYDKSLYSKQLSILVSRLEELATETYENEFESQKKKARDVLQNLIATMSDSFIPPMIGADEEGTIGLTWRTGDKTLRAVFPAEEKKPPFLYWRFQTKYDLIPTFSLATLIDWIRWLKRDE